MLCVRNILKIDSKHLSRYINKDRTGKAIRQKFLDYFINQNSHNFVKSSPVVPFCDPTVAFVNAGMNQFKGIFIGTQEAQHKKVANYQKCIRIGGKHNDLNVVGNDGYHHTFFEMLGNWSFGDYFKKEACELAWKLLTEEYKIPSSRLYVTYFKGDPDLRINEDLETKEIWKSIGVPEERILPFSSKDNFWEMGSTGPCGPCTEIHIDHIGTQSRAKLVNKGLHDLTELWNIVFIQYNRKSNNSIDLLPEKHIDTGMGFERLTAVLQDKISNYDTDNFSYLLKAINKNCSGLPEYKGRFGENDWDQLDASYRILADHARMITVCLADGIIPEQNQKLRRVMRKAFLLSETVFKRDNGLLKELTNYVIDHLGPVYNEMERNSKQIQQIIDYEEDVFKSIRKNASGEWEKLCKQKPELLSLDVLETPNLIAAYKDLKTANSKSITDKIAFRLYDAFGLDEETISKLARVCNLTFNPEDLRRELERAKMRSKEQSILNNNVIYDKLVKVNIPKTDVSRRYSYVKKDGRYIFEKQNIRVLKIFENMETVSEISTENYCSLVLDKSNFYTESGGQISDHGTITFDDHIFEVTEAQNVNGYILHKGFLRADENYKLKPGASGELNIHWEFRLRNMRNHTGIHILNAALKEIKGATCQKSSKVTSIYLNLDVGIFGSKITVEDVKNIEERIQELIDSRLEVVAKEVDSQELASLDYVTLIPGEIYPETGIRLIEIKGPSGFLSREPCCGTHLFNTSDLNDFAIISVKSLGRSTASIHAVTGDRAKIARANGVELLNEVKKIEKSIPENINKIEVLNMAVRSVREKLNFNIDDPSILPLTVKQECIEILNKINKQIKDLERGNSKQLLEKEMKNAIKSKISQTKNNKKYLVHYLEDVISSENIPLQKATRLCPDIPVLVISYADSVVKARCCVPKDFKESFSAEEWLAKTVAAVFKSKALVSKDQDSSLVCNMKPKRVKDEDWNILREESVKAAKKYVEDRL